MQARGKLLKRRFGCERDAVIGLHAIKHTALLGIFASARGAMLQVRFGFGRLFSIHAAVHEPRNEIPYLIVRCAVRSRLLAHGSPSGAVPASAGSSTRSFLRAWNMRVFTVLTGHFMIVAISWHEWPR